MLCEKENGKILAVTGAAGNKSGLAFTKLLVEHSNEIITYFSNGIHLLVRNPDKLNKIEKQIPKCKVWRGNLEDENYLRNSLKGVDTVLHIAGIHFSRHIVKIAVENQVRRLILVHTTGIYSKYKAAGEEYRNIDEFVYRKCKENGIVLTILRPTMIYGNMSDNNVIQFIKMVDRLPIMPVVNGAKYKLQPVHYEDLAEAYYKVLMNESITANKDYNLSGGAEIELRKMFSVIGENLGKKVRFISCPFPIAYIGAWGVYLLTFKKKDYREKVQRLCESRVFSYEDAKRDFNYAPRVFQIGIVNEVKEYLKFSNRQHV